MVSPPEDNKPRTRSKSTVSVTSDEPVYLHDGSWNEVCKQSANLTRSTLGVKSLSWPDISNWVERADRTHSSPPLQSTEPPASTESSASNGSPASPELPASTIVWVNQPGTHGSLDGNQDDINPLAVPFAWEESLGDYGYPVVVDSDDLVARPPCVTRTPDSHNLIPFSDTPACSSCRGPVVEHIEFVARYNLSRIKQPDFGQRIIDVRLIMENIKRDIAVKENELAELHERLVRFTISAPNAMISAASAPLNEGWLRWSCVCKEGQDWRQGFESGWRPANFEEWVRVKVHLIILEEELMLQIRQSRIQDYADFWRRWLGINGSAGLPKDMALILRWMAGTRPELRREMMKAPLPTDFNNFLSHVFTVLTRLGLSWEGGMEAAEEIRLWRQTKQKKLELAAVQAFRESQKYEFVPPRGGWQ
ncbi:hypothetical protein S7711_10583 [Stachybotrys chartarum IBT 7711]|uniref:Uncharacterized protein n=1 Tax=Stachybotrys chartarum (strain CBS 109288 / IBT 7711) TaxID=1280523 RepID=A0A084B5C3_STACB|nr:hypothetical protein S7711_10583 [Stachybotrys chartarum IBT 7711]